MSKVELIAIHTVVRSHPTIPGKQQEIAPGTRFSSSDAVEINHLVGAKAAKPYRPELSVPPSADEDDAAAEAAAKAAAKGKGAKAPTKKELAAAEAAEKEAAEKAAAAAAAADASAGLA